MEAEFLKRIVKEAEKISQKHFEVHQKDDKGDLVTSLDIEIEQYLISQIKENYPDFAIVSEESNSDKTVTDNCFIIDPIDGTINFANGIPLWGIQIACRKNGKTIASVIDLPRINEFYYADETGAYLNDKKLSVTEVPIKNTLYSIVGMLVPSKIEKMRKYSKSYRMFGAACIHFAFMASGKIHGVVHNYGVEREHAWDYEPGLFLCEMAGAKIISKPGFRAAAMNQEFLDILEKETALSD